MTETRRVVKFIDLVGTVFRVFLVQAAFNYEKMMNFGFAFAMGPVLKRLYRRRGEETAAVNRHLEFFNTHPYMVSFVAGIVANLEEKRANGQVSDEDIAKVKSGIMGPVAAIGDSVFWVTLKPLFACLAVLFCVFYGVAGTVIFVAGYNIVHVGTRVAGVFQGYRMGIDVQRVLRAVNVRRLLYAGTMGSLLVVGVLLAFILCDGGFSASSVALKAAFAGVTVLSVFLLRRNVSPVVIFAGLLVLALILGYAGLEYRFTGFEDHYGDMQWYQKH